MPHCPTCYTQGTNNHSLKHPLQHSLGGGFPKAVLCMGTMWGPSVSWEARGEEGVPAKVFFLCPSRSTILLCSGPQNQQVVQIVRSEVVCQTVGAETSPEEPPSFRHDI